MTTRYFCIRKYKGAYTPFALGIDAAIIKNVILLSSTVMLTFYRDNYELTKDFEWTWRTIIVGAISGTLMDSGSLLMGIAVAIGIAGPAQALMSTHLIHQTFWSAVIDKQALTVLQSSGLALGVVSVTVISLATYIEQLFERGDKKSNKVHV